MRYFIDKTGKLDPVYTEHRQHVRSLKRHIIHNVRIKIYKHVLSAELTGKITDAQRRVIRKLYRDYRCFDLIAVITGNFIDNIKGV